MQRFALFAGGRCALGQEFWLHRMSLPFFGCILLVLLIASSPASSADTTIITKHSAAIGVTMPLFGADKTVPAALLHIGKLSLCAQRRGIFRIGILPLLVAQGVEIEFRSQPPDASALGDLSSAFVVLGKTSAAELHDLSIVVARHPVLTAAEGRPASDASIRLSQVVISGGDSPDAATLRTNGGKAGELSYQIAGAGKALNLFKTQVLNPTP